ncbi:MAG: hypothetical protein HZY73_05740 [Micropruina sp.]|nr:MAG: hypothetical protein HZY73_05740 [Micropruina sp.]
MEAQLTAARAALVEAELAEHPAERFLAAHLAALRVAAVVLAARARPARRASRLSDVWRLLAEVAPEYAEWAGFFAATALKRQAVAAGAVALVSAREADDLIRDAGLFCEAVGRRLRPPARAAPVEGAGRVAGGVQVAQGARHG